MIDFFGRKAKAHADHLEAMLEQYRAMNADLQESNRTLYAVRDQVAVHNRALGRIIAKLDPLYGVDEQDPTRNAASDKLSDEIIKKITAEHKASQR